MLDRMLYAIVSDIHANLPAWKSVLADLTSLGAQRIICLGDVVGYGPQPQEVLASLYRHVDAFVMGNHDAVVCGKMTPERFNKQARVLVEWSTGQVSRKGKEFLAAAALSLTGDGFTCVHGEMGQPEAFRYIVGPEDTQPTWQATSAPIIFVGHTHRACLFVRGASGVPHPLPPEDFVLEDGKRYIVNVGSVGYPRDGDPRASYCLYDTEDQVVRFRRVPFDYEALRLAVQAAGLEAKTMPLLNHDPLQLRRPVRDQLEFDPADTDAQMAKGVTVSRDLMRLRKSNRRWRKVAVAGMVLAALMAGVAAAFALHRSTVAETAFPDKPLPVREAVVPSDVSGNLLPPLPYGLSGRLVEGWRYSFNRPDDQNLTIESDFSGPSPRVQLVHAKRAQLRLEAPEWVLNRTADGRLRATINAWRGEDFVGTVKIVVVVDERLAATDKHPRERVVLNFDLALNRKASWEETKRIMDIKKPVISGKTERVRYRVEADFIGTLSLADLSLVLAGD
jgi:predicted phosphodiesterase